ncbi:MAG: DUF5995 family protein [Actinobacteria bacterium]|nr:DUF5995 family protein [Actinomycetota bacterium]
MTDAVDSVVRDMRSRLDGLTVEQRYLGEFLGTYQRTTLAVGKAVDDGYFEDPLWVERWDVVFAKLYLDALDAYLSGGAPSRPWRLAFDAPPDLPALRHVLLGINAHVNYDLPQALLAVISDADFTDSSLIASRRRDHERIDSVLAGRVSAEDVELSRQGRSLTDRILQPLNRLSSRRFLREARTKVWHNAVELQAARITGPAAYDARLAELEVLSAARIADLLAPGQVLLRLAVAGFGVILPPPV